MTRILGFVLSLMLAVAIGVAAGPASSQPATRPASAPAKADAAYSAWAFDELDAAKKQFDAAKALHVSKEAKVDLGGGVAIEFVLIPAGKYMMGDPPGKETTIAKPFYMGKFLVTQAQYAKVMGKNPSQHKDNSSPADSIDWPSAADFCKKASEVTRKTIHLPSEAQWEWACRAGTATRCYWGDDMSKFGDYCWWHDNCGMVTHPVGQKKPNAFGLYDMMGNVWEWCSDGGGPEATDHPYRGATFGSKELMFKSTVRMTGGGPTANDRYGFRVAMDVD